MRSRLALAAVLLGPLAASAAVRPLVFVGVGFPELLRAEAGVFVTDRVTVELRAGLPLFNPEVGVGTSAYLLGVADGRPPRHALLATVEVRFNPILRPLRIESGADVLAAYVGTGVGYAFTSQVGFSLRVLATGLWYAERGLAFGATFGASVGWVF